MSPPDDLVPPHVFRLVCRPALPMDTPDVLELTRTIWEGHDYVPLVWQDWLKDPQGLLAVAEFGGRVVGISKLSLLSPSEWWLEGLRVHPDFQGGGIASHLHDYLLDYWESQRGEILRLATASYRVQVQHLCQRSGFRKIFEAAPYGAEPVPGPVERFSHLKAGEEAMALEMVQHAIAPTLPCGLMDIGWQWASPSQENIGVAVAQGRAWWWGSEPGGREAVLLARDDEEDDGQSSLVIQLIACPLERLAACLEDYRRLAQALGLKRAAWFAPLDAELEPSLLAAGYQRDWEDSLFVYEKRSSGISTPVTRYLDAKKIAYKVFTHPGPINSLEQAARERGQRPEQVVRSIVFRLSDSQFVMVLVAGAQQVSWPVLREYLGVTRMTMASPEEVQFHTGYPPGAVSPFGLPEPMRILVDREVFQEEEISIGSGKRFTTVILGSEDLRHLLAPVEIGIFTEHP